MTDRNQTETNSVPQITHNDHCWSYGSKHYECAIRHIARQHEQLCILREAAKTAILAIEQGRSFDHLDNVIAPLLADAASKP